MNEAICTYYKEFIDKNSSDQSKLFRAGKSLLNLQAAKSLPPHTDASSLANEMGEYFIHKIVAIRSKLASDTVSPAVTERAPNGSSSSDDVVTLSEFQPLRRCCKEDGCGFYEDMYSIPFSVIHLVGLL